MYKDSQFILLVLLYTSMRTCSFWTAASPSWTELGEHGTRKAAVRAKEGLDGFLIVPDAATGAASLRSV